MARITRTLGATALALVTGALLTGLHTPAAKDLPGTPSIPPERVADYLHAVLQADRTIYTTHIVARMQDKGIVAAAEHWEQDNALPLPAQFLQQSGRIVAESGSGIRYRLIGLSPIYQRNAPATEFERTALQILTKQPERPVTGIVTSGSRRFFQAVYADRAIASACIHCHNQHPLSPKRDFAMNDVMGGLAITIPLD